MKKWIVFIVLFFPTVVFANPIIDPFEMFNMGRLIFVIVLALAVEASIVTILLYFYHMELIPSLIAMFIGNLTIYFAIFLPILSAIGNVLIAETIIVATDGTFIKIISKMEAFQTEDFKGLKWRTAFICAAVGNTLSYSVGTLLVGNVLMNNS